MGRKLKKTNKIIKIYRRIRIKFLMCSFSLVSWIKSLYCVCGRIFNEKISMEIKKDILILKIKRSSNETFSSLHFSTLNFIINFEQKIYP